MFPTHCLPHPRSQRPNTKGCDLPLNRNPSFLSVLPSQKKLFLPHWASPSATYITQLCKESPAVWMLPVLFRGECECFKLIQRRGIRKIHVKGQWFSPKKTIEHSKQCAKPNMALRLQHCFNLCQPQLIINEHYKHLLLQNSDVNTKQKYCGTLNAN